MKSWWMTILLCCAVVLPGSPLQAQGVYVTQGEHGPVFSDKPQSGAKEVTLRPLTVLEAPKVEKGAAAKGPASNGVVPQAAGGPNARRSAASSAYQSLAILSPENESSVIINTGAIDVRVVEEPPLQLGEGHAFAVRLNGRDVGQRFTSSEFVIPPEFWGGNLPINQFAQLDVSIVDAQGRVLLRAAPVRFLLRYTTVLNNPNYYHPPVVHQPVVIQPMIPIVPVTPVTPMTPAAPYAPVTSTPQQKPVAEKATSSRTSGFRADR